MLLADMPGVEAKDLAIDLNDNVLTVSGDAKQPEGKDEVDILKEYRTGKYFRQFTVSEVINQAEIGAALKHGVLRLNMPKVEAAKPRKIPVKVG